jgi:hypothetical protein
MNADSALPALAPVVLPKTMREKKVLTHPGSCIGPACAHGGLHFSLKPLAWTAPPSQAMPAAGQMPAAAAAAAGMQMPSLKWQQGPVTWHNEDGVFATQEHAWAHATGQQEFFVRRAEAEYYKKIFDNKRAAAVPPQQRAVPRIAVHQAHLDHQQALSAQQRQQPEILMGNTAPPAKRRKQEAVARLAKKLARQISDTGDAASSPGDAAGAPLNLLKLAGAKRPARW